MSLEACKGKGQHRMKDNLQFYFMSLVKVWNTLLHISLHSLFYYKYWWYFILICLLILTNIFFFNVSIAWDVKSDRIIPQCQQSVIILKVCYNLGCRLKQSVTRNYLFFNLVLLTERVLLIITSVSGKNCVPLIFFY